MDMKIMGRNYGTADAWEENGDYIITFYNVESDILGNYEEVQVDLVNGKFYCIKDNKVVKFYDAN